MEEICLHHLVASSKIISIRKLVFDPSGLHCISAILYIYTLLAVFAIISIVKDNIATKWVLSPDLSSTLPGSSEPASFPDPSWLAPLPVLHSEVYQFQSENIYDKQSNKSSFQPMRRHPHPFLPLSTLLLLEPKTCWNLELALWKMVTFLPLETCTKKAST